MDNIDRVDNQQESSSQGLRYRRLLQLGSGGMATVHLALASGQNDFSRLVVVKAVREGNAAVEELRRMFLAEARLSARLNHPNVVQVYEVVESDHTVMLVMEYLDGLSLAEAYLMAASGFSLAMRLRVLCDVLHGLHYAHELADYEGNPLGIVHRDVSPQNVFLTYDGRVKLLDFGIAKATQLVGADETREGVVKGRVAYMPVEQFTGEKTDRRTDVYAVGCMIWEAVAGTRMWGKSSDVEILQKVWAGTLPNLREMVDVDDELATIVERATAHRAEDRYPTAEALRLDLEAYLRKLPPATARDVGAYLSETCSEQREMRKRLIADAVIKVKSAAPHSASRSESSGSLRSLVTSTAAPSEVTAEYEKPVRRPWVMPAAVAGAAVLFGVIIGVVGPRSQPSSEPASSAVPSAAQNAVLTIRTVPEDATVLLNGRQVLGNPPKLEVSAGSEHTLRVERSGFETDERRVRVEHDTTLNVELEARPAAETEAAPQKKEGPPRRAAPRAPAPVRQAAPAHTPPVVTAPRSEAPSRPAASRPTNNCDPPFYFDKGIKTFKPECI